MALTENGDFHPLAEGIDHGDPHPMKTPRNFVSSRAKLAARMEHGQHRFQGAFPGAGMDVGGNPTPVVGDTRGPILVKDNRDLVAMASEGFIDGVVHHLVNEVV
jgi:hypothetical protein